MNKSYQKYKAFVPEAMAARKWPENTLSGAPVWCSVDLRDGNQALVNPMNLEEKLRFFRLLTDIGFKEIEVGFPAASDTEFAAVRRLIEDNLIPEDVAIQVLVQARAPLIDRTFEAIDGAKNVIFHFYNTTSDLQRRVVFQTDIDGVTKIAADAAKHIREASAPLLSSGTRLRFEYTPESFSGTRIKDAVQVCAAVMDELGATAENPVILNLPNTVEGCMPNQFADMVESFCNQLPGRERAVISVHPHNDRGTGVAAAELALLAGAQRVEGTLFGNGERTGNADLMTLAMNLYSQGINPGLDFSRLDDIRRVYEQCTQLLVPERHPYAGALAFTAFSGSHQDAINKGLHYMQEHHSPYWEVPYLPIDPADVGRQYEPIIRINSQSGKGGAAFVMEKNFGFKLPRAMQAEFGALVQKESDAAGREIAPQRIFDLFSATYINNHHPYSLLQHNFQESVDEFGRSHVSFSGTLRHKETIFSVFGEGNGPIDAFFNAIHGQKMDRFIFVDYSEHAVTNGSDSQAAAYIHLRTKDGRDVFGVGMSHNINLAPLRGIISAVNRAQQ